MCAGKSIPRKSSRASDVYKSQSADLVAGGVAGTIDIKTIRPLNYSGPELLFAAAAGLLRSRRGHSRLRPATAIAAAPASRIRIGDNFAFNLGASAQRQKNAFPSFQGWGYNDGSHPLRPTPPAISMATARPNPTPWGAQTEVKKLTEDRFGVNGAIGWRAGDSFELNVDALYSKFTIDEDQNQAWYGRNGSWGNWANGNAVVLQRPASSTTPCQDGSIVGRRSTTATRPSPT